MTLAAPLAPKRIRLEVEVFSRGRLVATLEGAYVSLAGTGDDS